MTDSGGSLPKKPIAKKSRNKTTAKAKPKAKTKGKKEVTDVKTVLDAKKRKPAVKAGTLIISDEVSLGCLREESLRAYFYGGVVKQ